MVVVSGKRADTVTAVSKCVTVLHTAGGQPDQSAFEDAACWGYHPPNNKVPPRRGHTSALQNLLGWIRVTSHTDAGCSS